MNKTRLEAFDDAVLAIIMTIMILEIRVPISANWLEVRSSLSYIFAYVLSFLGIVNLWYMHQFLFNVVKKIGRTSFWINNFLLLVVSFFPWVTAWVGRFPFQRGPEYFYVALQILWAFFLFLLRTTLISDNRKDTKALKSLTEFAPLNSRAAQIYTIAYLLLLIVVYFLPVAGLISIMVQMLIPVVYFLGSKEV